MNVRLGGKKLEYSKTHIVFEAGPTHTGIESAKQLADLAKIPEQIQSNFRPLMLID